jgi:hypothetical protein
LCHCTTPTNDVAFIRSAREWERIFQKKASRIESNVKWNKVQFSDLLMLLYMLYRRQRAGCSCVLSSEDMLGEPLDQLINVSELYPVVIVLFMLSTAAGTRIGARHYKRGVASVGIGTLTAAGLVLLALLLAFSLAHALSRFEARRDLILEEAVAIESTAKLAAMLPNNTKKPIADLLRDYAAVRIGLGVPHDPTKLDRDAARSTAILTAIWQEADVSEQSLTDDRFISALDNMTKVQERRLTAHRQHVPSAVIVTLLGVAMVALGLTGYESGISGSRNRGANLIMACTVAIITVLVIDLDQPMRGLIKVPLEPLIEVGSRIGVGADLAAARR